MLRTETVRNRANRRERDRKGAGNGLSWGTTGWRVNSNQLKLIAVAAMLVDHAAVVFAPEDFPGLWLLRLVGRMTAPIMCYLIAEGYYHTHNLKRYMGRLFLMGIVSHIPHNLCMGYDLLAFWEATDVMFSLLLGLAALAIWEREGPALWQKGLLIGLCCLVAYSADWNYIAVLWILGFGMFRGSPALQMAAFSLVGALYLLQPLVYGTSFPYISRLGIFLVIPLLLRYNGQRGRRSRLIQWGFYWFYPVHLLVLYLLGRVV